MLPNNSPIINPYANVTNNPYAINMPQYTLPASQQNGTVMMSWIQGGLSGAKSYPLAPNSRAYLFDSDEECFYIKVTDQTGVTQPLRRFDYSETPIEEELPVDTSKWATKDEIDEIKDMIADLSGLLRSNNNQRKGGNNNGKSFVRGTNEPRNNG